MYANSDMRRSECIRQNQEMDVVNVIIRFISELRTSASRIKDIVCEKYIAIIKRMECDHKLEREALS